MMLAGGGGMLDEGGSTIVQVGTALLSTMVAQQIADAIPGQVDIEKRSNLRGDVAHQKVFNARKSSKSNPSHSKHEHAKRNDVRNRQ